MHLKQQPLVSVIIPVYNAADFLPETLESVFSQSLGTDRLEVIAVDDGSTDESLSFLEQTQTAHSNLTVVSIPNTGSAAIPRNNALDMATGKYVFFLDADDKLTHTALEAMVDIADRSGSGVILGQMENFGPGAKRPLPRRVFEQTRFAEDFVESFAYKTLGPCKMFRRSLIEENGLRFATGYQNGEDLPFVMAAYFASPHISAVSDRDCYMVRNHGANASSRSQRADLNWIKNKNVIDVVVRNTEAGERRDTLLERSFISYSGLQSAFGRRYRELPPELRSRMLEEAAGYAEFWSEGLRAKADPSVSSLLDFVFSGDEAAVDYASSAFERKIPLPLRASEAGVITATTPEGSTSGPILNYVPKATLESLSFEADGIAFSGAVDVIDGDAEPKVRAVWKHRKSGQEVPIDVQRLPAGNSRIAFFSRMDARQLDVRDVWDAYVEVDYGQTQARVRFGADKRETFPTTPTIVSKNGKDVVFFTEYGNLSFDIGTTRKHVNPQTAAVIISDEVNSGKRQLVIHSRSVEGVFYAEYGSENTKKRVHADPRVTGRNEAVLTFPTADPVQALFQETPEGNRVLFQFARSVRGPFAVEDAPNPRPLWKRIARAARNRIVPRR